MDRNEETRKERFQFRHLLLFLFLYIFIIGSIAAALPLSGDEAYYWDCGRHLDWSYYDQPPLMIWLTRLFCFILGNHALVVRMPSLLFAFLSGLLLIRWLGNEGFWIFFILHLTPLFFFGSFYLSTDAGLSFFWLLGTFFVLKIRDDFRFKYWIGFGLALGLGFLAKFPIILLLPVLLTLPWKRVRLSHLLSSLFLAAILSLPVLLYALQHEGANIIFQLSTRHRTSISILRNQLIYWMPLLIFLGPVLPVAAIYLVQKNFRKDRVLFWSGTIPFFFFAIAGLRVPVAPHWGAPGIQNLAILTGKYWKKKILLWGSLSNLVIITLLLVLLFAPQLFLWVNPKVMKEFFGLNTLTAMIEKEQKPGEIIASESYSLTALVNFRLSGERRMLLANVNRGSHGLSYLYWQEGLNLRGKDLLFVTSKKKAADEIAKYVERIDTLIEQHIFVSGHSVRLFYLVHAHGLKEDSIFKP